MTRNEILKVKNGDFLTTKYGSIILVHHVEPVGDKGVKVYFYFDYDPKDMGLGMNEWLDGFYGPKFDDENFYRHSTDDEIKTLTDKMRLLGYEWRPDMGFGGCPFMTKEEIHRRRNATNGIN